MTPYAGASSGGRKAMGVVRPRVPVPPPPLPCPPPLSGNWGNLIELTWITSAIQLLPIFFVYCEYKGVKVLPDNQEETKAQVRVSPASRSEVDTDVA